MKCNVEGLRINISGDKHATPMYRINLVEALALQRDLGLAIDQLAAAVSARAQDAKNRGGPSTPDES